MVLRAALVGRIGPRWSVASEERSPYPLSNGGGGAESKFFIQTSQRGKG